MIEKEFRKIENNISNSENRKIEGYALVYNSLSEDLGGFVEKIDENALNGVLEKSDVFALLNHDNSRGILARSKFGNGTLTLTNDSHGLKYEFEAPNTALGDETLEMLKRGDITASSFAFNVETDKVEKLPDGKLLRTILKFGELFDCSPVYQPAYSATSVIVSKRMLEYIEEEKRDIKVNIEITNEKECEDTTEEAVDETEIETDSVDEVRNSEEEIIEEVRELETIEEEIKDEITEERNSDEKEEKKINKKNMENSFKLIDVIRKITNGEEFSEVEQTVLDAGKSIMKRSNISTGTKNTITIPFEMRADITATGVGSGIENVSEQKLQILGPLYANEPIIKAGAQVLSNLVGDVSIPRYAGSSANWKGETATATDGAGVFDEVTLKPKRITSILKISSQFLAQDANTAEPFLQNDLNKSVWQKFNSTILAEAIATAERPQGLFYGVTGTTVPTYTGFTALVAQLENKNVANYSYIVNPSAKAALKGIKINEGRMLFEDNAIDGVPTYSTSAVYGKGVVLADWSDLVIGVWAQEITFDPYSLAENGEIKLVVNTYIDAAFRRPSYVAINLA